MVRQFLVPGSDSPEPFETADTAFDNVAATIRLFVKPLGSLRLVLFVSDNGLDVVLAKPISQPTRGITFVPRDFGGLLRPGEGFFENSHSLLGFVLLSGTDGHRQGSALTITDPMHFGAKTPLRTAQGMILGLLGVARFASTGGGLMSPNDGTVDAEQGEVDLTAVDLLRL